MRIGTPLGDLYVDDVGEGSPVLLWHSYLHHGGMWKAQVDALKSKHRLLVIDAPGHGRSSPVRKPFDLVDCVRSAEAVMDACGVEKSAFVGLSWGGMVAMAMALKNPERLTGIVPIDTSCRREPLGNRLKYLTMGSVTRKVGIIPALLDRVEPLFYSAQSRAERRADLVDPWRSYVARMDRESIWHALHCIIDRNNITEQLRALRMPAMAIVGAVDIAQPVRESEHIASAIPGCRLVVIPGAAHLSAEEKPREMNAILEDFLSRLAVG